MSKFGYIKDLDDRRDFLMKGFLPRVDIVLPKSVDLTDKMSPVRNQGNEGTCVGFASVVGMKEYQELQDYKKLVLLSPRFLYNECKKIDGIPNQEGTYIRTAMQVLKKVGVCQEDFWPYQPHQKDKPKDEADSNARKFCVMGYARISGLEELKQSLFFKGPCVIGVKVFKGMMNTKNGVVRMPKCWERSLSGHAICPVGYNDERKLVKFKNSWSEAWGNKGWGFLPYAYIEKYMMDGWSSVDIDDPVAFGHERF